jgi:HSP20 family protein
MLMRSDPFRDLDRLAQQVLGAAARPSAMAMDAYRSGDEFVVHFDLPGIDPDSIDVNVERDVLTVRAERPTGVFTRRLFLGDTLDTDAIEASYDAGVLTLRIPVAEQAKPRRIQISAGGDRKQIGG